MSLVRYSLLGVVLVCSLRGWGLTVYLSPSGSDAWSGTLPAPDPGLTDGPLASLEAARDKVRNLRTLGALSGPVDIVLRGGDYYRLTPFLLEPEDSGTAAQPVTFTAYPGELPVIHGGLPLGPWVQSGPFYTTQAPPVPGGVWNFNGLWMDGVRRTPARTPNATNESGDYPTDNDFFFAAGQVGEPDGLGGETPSSTRFQYRPGDLQSWPALADAHVVVFHAWATSLLRVQSLDELNQIVTFTGAARWPFGNWRSDQWYYVEHLLEGLDQPGEWHVDRATGLVRYIPLPGEDLAAVDAVIPAAPHLLLLQGSPAAGAFVEHVSFRGIGFAYTHFALPPAGYSDGQATYGMGAAVEARGARNCVFDRCEFKHTAGYALWLREGSQDNAVTHCEFRDLGAGGIRVGETTTPPSPPRAVERNLIDNNFLHDGGRFFREAAGIWVGRSSHNTISHNDIGHFRFTAISVGWQWDYLASTAHHNLVECNRIHDIGKQQLNDLGGIYTLGVSTGTIVRKNLVYNVLSNPKLYGGWGLYTDEGSSNILFESNIVYGTESGAFHQHYGQNNVVRNNILAFSRNSQLMRTLDEPGHSFDFLRNIVYFNNGDLLGNRWSDDHFAFDYNLYWDTSGRELDFAGRSWEEWQAAGMDLHSLNADPGFTDPAEADFSLSPASPALGLGFIPIDTTEIGLYGEPEWVSKPYGLPEEPFAPPNNARIEEDFESTSVGSVALNAGTKGEEAPAGIRVTDETAHGGARSLRFSDAPGLSRHFYPYLEYTPIVHEGTATAGFALKFSPGALLYHEWRDNHVPYRAGPSIWVDGNSLKVNGVSIAALPPNTWIQFEIQCALDELADGTFSLSITPEGQPTQVFANLACRHPEFKRIDWFGFVSDADAAQVFEIDDILLFAEAPPGAALSGPAPLAVAMAILALAPLLLLRRRQHR